MVKIKLIELLQSLSDDEIRQFDKFVRSPVHNKHEKVIRLFKFLRKHIKDHPDKISTETMYKAIFPGESLKPQRLHHVSSYLVNVLHEYLAWTEWKKDPVVSGLHLTRALGSRQLEKHFTKSLENTRATHHDQSIRDAGFYVKEYQLQFEEYKHARTQGRTREFNLQELTRTHDIAYIAEKLKNTCVLLSHQAVTKKSYDMGPLDEIIGFLQGHPFLEIPTIAIYYLTYKALTNQEDDEAFAQLKSKLFDLSHLFKVAELRDLYIHAINFCIKKLNTGNEKYRREVFDIYQSGLTLDVFVNQGVMSPWTYSNIVQVGLMLKEFAIIESVINRYREYLPKDKREAYYSYNYAWFYYQKKDYKMAMQLLLKTDYGGDLLITCTAKTLLTRMYFELDEIDSLDSLLRSFKVFLQRKKVLAYHKELYMNFIHFVKLIANRSWKDEPARQALIDEIKTTQVLAAKDWLLEQLEQ